MVLQNSKWLHEINEGRGKDCTDGIPEDISDTQYNRIN